MRQGGGLGAADALTKKNNRGDVAITSALQRGTRLTTTIAKPSVPLAAGDLSGIVGGAMPAITSLELPALASDHRPADDES